MEIIYKWFTGLDIVNLTDYISEYIRQKMLDTKELEKVKFCDIENDIRNIIAQNMNNLLFKVQEFMNIEEIIPCTEKEKQEILCKIKQSVREELPIRFDKFSGYSVFGSWLNTFRNMYEKTYFPCVVKYYDIIQPEGGIGGLYMSQEAFLGIVSVDENFKEKQKKIAEEERKKIIRIYRELNKGNDYYTLMMEEGGDIHKNINDSIKNIVNGLFRDDFLIKERIPGKNWGTLIYNLILAEFYVAVIDKKRQKDVQIAEYNYDKLDKACKKYISDYHLGGQYNSKNINVEKFCDVFKIYQKIDSRLQMTFENNSSEDIKKIKISFPKNMYSMLFVLTFNKVDIYNKGESKKIYPYEVIKNVIDEIEKKHNDETSSVRKLLYDYSASYIFSHNVFNSISENLILNKKATGKTFVFDTVEDWNKYTGQLITNSIWSALTENKENDFFILAYNSNVPKEDKEKLDKALYSCIEELISLKNYFSYVEIALISYKLFGCIGILGTKIKKDISYIIYIFETIAYVLKSMPSDLTYEYWENCASLIDEIEELEEEIEDTIVQREIYNEYFVRKYSYVKLNESERDKYNILYKKIEKAVLFNLYRKK